MNNLKPSSDAIEVALEKVLSSAPFRNRPQLRRLLTHLVEYSTAEDGGPLKEYTLGVDVFDRGTRFDPQCDSIVRVETFNLRKALRAYYTNEGRSDPATIGVPTGGYRVTFCVNEEPPSAILDDPERLCRQVEWSLLGGSADDIARIQRHVQHAIVRWPGRADLLVSLASTTLAALELECVSPVDTIGVMRQAAQAALRCDPTRRDAEFYATIHRIMGAHKETAIAAAHRWRAFAPKSALAHFWVGATLAANGSMCDAVAYLQQARPASALRDVLSDLVRSGTVLHRSRGCGLAAPARTPGVRARRLSDELLARSAGVSRTPLRRGAGGGQSCVSGVWQHASACRAWVRRGNVGICRVSRSQPGLARAF